MTTIDTIEDGDSAGLPLHRIEAFLEHLRKAGYSDVTRRKKRIILTAFARWMEVTSVPLAQLDESVITAFVKSSTCAPASRAQFERAVLRLLPVSGVGPGKAQYCNARLLPQNTR
jgi:hypothetical protein